LEERNTFRLNNFRVNLHVEYNEADGEYEEESDEANDEGYQVNDTELDHLHQEPITLEDSHKEEHFHERHDHDQKLQFWDVAE
jgi:hypothetical protein